MSRESTKEVYKLAWEMLQRMNAKKRRCRIGKVTMKVKP